MQKFLKNNKMASNAQHETEKTTRVEKLIEKKKKNESKLKKWTKLSMNCVQTKTLTDSR